MDPIRKIIRDILNEEHRPVRGGEKQMRWGDGSVASLNDRLENGIAVSKFISQENAVQYNRVKWNRLDGNEQKAYAEKMNRKVMKFDVQFKDESFVAVPKAVYDQITLPELPEKNFFQQH